MTDDEIIAAHIARHGVTKCSPAFLMASPQSHTAPPAIAVAPPVVEAATDADWDIARKYTTEMGTAREIALQIGISERRVIAALRRCGIVSKPLHLRRSRARAGGDIGTMKIDANTMAAIVHYRERGPISIREVAEAYRIGYDRFRKLLRCFPNPAIHSELDAVGLKRLLHGGQNEGVSAAESALQAGNGGGTDLGVIGKFLVGPSEQGATGSNLSVRNCHVNYPLTVGE